MQHFLLEQQKFCCGERVPQYFRSIHYGEELPTWDINTAEFMVGHFRAMTTEEALVFTMRPWVTYLTLGIEQRLTLYAILKHILDKLNSVSFSSFLVCEMQWNSWKFHLDQLEYQYFARDILIFPLKLINTILREIKKK
jgi:hypothetical protein